MRLLYRAPYSHILCLKKEIPNISAPNSQKPQKSSGRERRDSQLTSISLFFAGSALLSPSLSSFISTTVILNHHRRFFRARTGNLWRCDDRPIHKIVWISVDSVIGILIIIFIVGEAVIAEDRSPQGIVFF